MQSNEYLRAGKLKEAIQSLGEELRQKPLDTQRRTFLFELLCFAGEYDRCEKQLEVLAQGGRSAEIGTLLYRAALQAEKSRQQFFADHEYAKQPAPALPRAGSLNGSSFHQIADADPRIGPRLEVILGGSYIWIPFEHIASINIQPPKRLRDLIWTPALVRTGPSFKERELGEVLLPVLSPGSWQHPEDEVRLGRVTVWEQQQDGVEVPFGQKMLLVDGEEVPLLELRNLELEVAAAA
ncbi:MAG: virulence protein SciE type [Acidobacteria bacterium]|nr:MAG: virulence protein SciE type [Acidobacteriota bacterium]